MHGERTLAHGEAAGRGDMCADTSVAPARVTRQRHYGPGARTARAPSADIDVTIWL